MNHLGFAELLYLAYSDGCCFLSKIENKKLPFIGKITEILQSIFVDRVSGERKQTSIRTESTQSFASSNNGNNSSTVEQILERAHSPPGTWPPLCICPEGTTHTGHCLIRFQNYHCDLQAESSAGSFENDLPDIVKQIYFLKLQQKRK